MGMVGFLGSGGWELLSAGWCVVAVDGFNVPCSSIQYGVIMFYLNKYTRK